MKQRSLTFFFLGLAFAVSGQTLKDAKTRLYYHRYVSAKTILENVLQQNPGSTEAWYWLGELYLAEKKTDSAEKAFLEGIRYAEQRSQPKKNEPLVYAGWAHFLLDKGEKAAALQLMEELALLSKYKKAEVMLALARAHLESVNGDPATALQLLQKAVKKDKNNPALYTAMGDYYRKQIDGSNAVIHYNKALEADPGYAEAYYKKGLIYKRQQNTEIFVDRFTRAINADTAYAPALYELYQYYFYSNQVEKAGKMLDRYLRHSDPGIENAYLLTDYRYINGEYAPAIESALRILNAQGEQAKPRLYKLMAYSHAALGDSVAAEKNMQAYFARQKAADCVIGDYELMARVTLATSANQSDAIPWYRKALALEKDTTERIEYMSTLADLQKAAGNREKEALWRERIYTSKVQPNNLDLFNWGVALYMSENYQRADSIFGLYSARYTDQVYGPLWQARCNAVIDSTMELGLAVPYYEKLVELAASEPAKYKQYLLKAYGYLGTYEANTRKNYPASLAYFEKMLELEPGNSDARKYVELLENWIEEGASG